MTDWSLARCRETDPEVFFPTSGGSPVPGKAICSDCEIQVDCLDEALQMGDVYGIWGGTTQWERKRLRQLRDTSTT